MCRLRQAYCSRRWWRQIKRKGCGGDATRRVMMYSLRPVGQALSRRYASDKTASPTLFTQPVILASVDSFLAVLFRIGSLAQNGYSQNPRCAEGGEGCRSFRNMVALWINNRAFSGHASPATRDDPFAVLVNQAYALSRRFLRAGMRVRGLPLPTPYSLTVRHGAPAFQITVRGARTKPRWRLPALLYIFTNDGGERSRAHCGKRQTANAGRGPRSKDLVGDHHLNVAQFREAKALNIFCGG